MTVVPRAPKTSLQRTGPCQQSHRGVDEGTTDLLPVVGSVREQSGDVEHDLVVLVRRVE